MKRYKNTLEKALAITGMVIGLAMTVALFTWGISNSIEGHREYQKSLQRRDSLIAVKEARQHRRDSLLQAHRSVWSDLRTELQELADDINREHGNVCELVD